MRLARLMSMLQGVASLVLAGLCLVADVQASPHFEGVTYFGAYFGG